MIPATCSCGQPLPVDPPWHFVVCICGLLHAAPDRGTLANAAGAFAPLGSGVASLVIATVTSSAPEILTPDGEHHGVHQTS